MAESNEVKPGDGDRRGAPPVTSPSMPPDASARSLGEACALGLAASIVASLPVALRSSGAGGSAVGGLIGSTAMLVVPLVVLVHASQAAGRALRLVTGRGAQRSTAVGLALWAGLSAPLFLILASGLKAATNHRGLGGATFGGLALLVAIATALAAHRLVAVARRLVERGAAQAVVDRVCLGIAFALAMATAVVGLRANDGAEASSRLIAALVDGALASIATILAASFDLPATARRVARIAGLPAAAIVFVVGLAWVERSPTLSRAMQARGGLGPAILAGLEGWTDRDGDGSGAHFGGLDCDDGDPRSHRGALDVPHDGVDADCDGSDAPRIVADAAPTARTATAPSPPAAPGPNAAAVHRSGAGPRATDKPSIVLVTMDSVRADRTSTFGYAKKTTPALDALAARGVAFEHAYAVASDTQRSIAPLVSGRRLSRTARDAREWPTIQGSVETLAERMRAAGYATAAVTSFTWLSKDRGFDQGFDDFEPVYEKDHPERGVTGPHAVAAARAIVAKRDADPKPLFLWVHLFDAHERWVPHPGHDFGKKASGLYDGEIAFVDKQIAALTEAIAASSRADATAFVVHGTHGEGFGEHGVEGHGSDLWEQQIHVPLVVALPGAREGRYARGAVSVADLPATILELGGASADGVEGRSLVAIARGALDTPGVPVDARATRRAAWIDWPLKLLVTKRKGKKNKDRYVLFDLAADPAEEKDLAASRNEDLVRMIALDQRQGEDGATPSD
jgi:choline-sulfatase